MTGDCSPFSLTACGFLIVEECATAQGSNSYREAFGPYCGVDRLTAITPVTVSDDKRMTVACEEWFDARFQTTAFIPDHGHASRLVKTFQRLGHSLELLFCQLAWKPGEASRLNTYPQVQLPRNVLETYGFDVSWPTCNHSAILQPGVVPTSTVWRSRLNQHGLLAEYMVADQLREQYLFVYPNPPFDIYLVHRVPPI